MKTRKSTKVIVRQAVIVDGLGLVCFRLEMDLPFVPSVGTTLVFPSCGIEDAVSAVVIDVESLQVFVDLEDLTLAQSCDEDMSFLPEIFVQQKKAGFKISPSSLETYSDWKTKGLVG